jgi:hypothetical protein
MENLNEKLKELLERKIISQEIVKGEKVYVEKQLLDHINENDIYLVDGKPVMKHIAIQKLARAVGAYWVEVDIVDTPRQENDRGYGVKVKCEFPDGSISLSTASANDKNTIDKSKPNNTISNDYKLEMAEKRASDRAFLRSNYVGLFDVSSSEEAEVFSTDNKEITSLKNIIRKLKEENDRLKKQNKEIPTLMESINHIALPEDDEKYPGLPILQVWSKHQDLEYIQKLADSKNKTFSWIAKGMLHKISMKKEA